HIPIQKCTISSLAPGRTLTTFEMGWTELAMNSQTAARPTSCTTAPPGPMQRPSSAMVSNTLWDGMLGRGIYLSCDLKKASRYPIKTPDSERVVLMVEVNVGT
ncbi:unnamed protein product, partial [Gadus morhua 'NCC']